MRRPPSHSLLGPALVLYMVADAAAAQGQLDALGAAIAICSGVFSLTAVYVTQSLDHPGSRRVGWLGLCFAGVVLREVAPAALSLPVDAASVVATAAAAALLLDLALTVPDSLLATHEERALRALGWASCGLGALAGLGAHAPVVHAFGGLLLLPAWYGAVPRAMLSGAVVLALAIRVVRPRAGSDAQALASNTWALLGLVPAAAVVASLAGCAAFGVQITSFNARAAQLALACLLLWSHARLLDPARRSSVARATRRIVPAAATLAMVGVAAVFARPWWPTAALLQAAATVAIAVTAFVLHRALHDWAQEALAPTTTRTTQAFERGRSELNSASAIEAVARAALGAARRACGDPNCEPVLYLFNPPIAFRLDAAGFPHADALPPHPELVRALRAEPRRILVRRDLDGQWVRSPGQRPLIEVLGYLEALCVLPLAQHGELEGALLMPRGSRRSEPGLEELEVLRRFGEQLAAFIALLSAEARAQRRAEAAHLQASGAEAERARVQAELARNAVETRALQLGGALAQPPRPEVAYSKPMRALLERLAALAAEETHVLLWAELGTPLSALMRQIHAGSARAQRPFFTGDCAALGASLAAPTVLGRDDEALGWLQIARDGTLALFDVVALPLEVQRELVSRLGGAGAPREASHAAVRLIASCRADPKRLLADGALDPALLQRVVCVRVPALRERGADLPSLVLLALDRSARLLGRAPVGITPEAEARLRAHDWPGNQDELEGVIVRASARCRGLRVGVEDLPPLTRSLAPPPDPDQVPEEGTLDAIEKRALIQALERTGGNKSEAARLLGLKRTTFLDKLRRHRLDGRPSSAVPN